MRGRKPEKFQLKPTDKAYLRKLLRDGEMELSRFSGDMEAFG